MKRDGKYRFSLQFSDDTAEGRKAGELLEGLGNRKSMIIVAALNEYLEGHPELYQENCSIQVSVTPVASPDELERMVRRVVEERINSQPTRPSLDIGSSSSFLSGIRAGEERNPNDQNNSLDEQGGGQQPVLKELEADVSQMLDNLDFFQ